MQLHSAKLLLFEGEIRQVHIWQLQVRMIVNGCHQKSHLAALTTALTCQQTFVLHSWHSWYSHEAVFITKLHDTNLDRCRS